MPQGEMAITGGTGEATRSRGSVNPPFDHFPKVQSHDNLIQRGYLRLLTEVFDYNNPDASHRTPYESVHRHAIGAQLNFQFNPNQLTRSVAARTDTQLWINQSPTQLLQPGIGDMSFGWTMLFNREAEVRKRHSRIPTAQRSPNSLESNDTPLDDLSQDAKAERLGVIADIMVLDQITGQRITQQAVEYSRDRYERLKKAGVVTAEEANVGTETLAELEDSLERIGLEYSDLTSLNANNSAFLVPNPIRAVFSENFMVDGYVNSVTVSYQKFSPEMIPTVAIVDISMHAIYQGFARKNTTFTTLLELAANEDYNNPNRVPDEATTPSEGGLTEELGDLGRNYVKPSLLITTLDRTSLGDIKLDISEQRGSTSGATKARLEGGLTFGYLGLFLNNTPLGDRLLELKDEGHWAGVRPNLEFRIELGLSLRARLKTTDQAAFDLLLGGNLTNTDVFFGGWSPEARSQLFAAGVDPHPSDVDRSGRDRADDTLTQSGTLYTKSFPIMELDDLDDDLYSYGDYLYTDLKIFTDSDLVLDEVDTHPTAMSSRTQQAQPDVLRVQDRVEWGKADGDTTMDFWLAKGFYDSSTYAACPPNISLTDGTNSYTYAVQYQLLLSIRLRLNHTGSTGGELMDTGMVVVHPKDFITEEVLVGSDANAGVGVAAAYPWLTSTSTDFSYFIDAGGRGARQVTNGVPTINSDGELVVLPGGRETR